MFEKGRSKYETKPLSDGLKIHKTCCNQLCSCSFSLEACCWLLKTQITSQIQGKWVEGNRDMFPQLQNIRTTAWSIYISHNQKEKEMMLGIVQPSQSKDSCDSNPKATTKPPHKTLPKMCRQPDVGIAGKAFRASGSCKQQPNGSRNSPPCKNI